MSSELRQIEAAITGLESQRALLGDAIADAALAPLRAKLAALVETPSQTLKQVSILFLDIVGSTALSQQLDPEDTHAIIDDALARCTSVVEAHRGKVLQYAGDSLLAVFGADEAREDDPERAVRAGLALLAEGRSLGVQVKCQHGHDGFSVRVGLHTGDVLLGGGVDAEQNVRGTNVNIAARMEQTAPAGGLRISHDTFRHVRGLFDVEPQQPMTVKGLDQPVITYLVLRDKPRAFRVATRGVEGIQTQLVGRDAELELLRDAFRRLCRQGQMRVLIVVAEAGIGKSRLLYEFDDWTRARSESFHAFQGRANPQTKSQPYGLMRDIFAWWFQIADNDSTESAKRKIEQGIAPLFQRDDGEDMALAHAHLLGHLVGLDYTDSRHIKGIIGDGKQIRDRGFHAAAQMFRRVAAQDGAPILLLLDDLQWADDGSLDFLNYLAQINRDVPLLMLGLARPALFDRIGDWSDTKETYQRIDLLPLDNKASSLLVDELLGKLEVIPSSLRELISGSAEGNPFYMEEFVKMLVDQGAIAIGAERWTLNPGKLLATHVPQTLTGVLQARLDSLAPAERLALQQASVIGAVFWDKALAAIAARAIDSLPALTQCGLLIPHSDVSLDGVREYAFTNQILQQVTYNTVLKRLLREYHGKAAKWLAASARASDFLGMAAEHFEKAGDIPTACEFFARAAEHAAERYAHKVTLEYVAEALALVGDDKYPDKRLLRWRLLDVRERTLDVLGRRAEQRADIDSLQQVADDMDDDRHRGEAAWRRSGVSISTADYRTGESAARQSLAFAQRAGAEELSLRAQHRLAIALHQLGEVAAGKALAQRGLAAAHEQELRAIEGNFLGALAFMASVQGDPVEYLELAQQTLLIDRERGDRRSEASALGNLGTAWLGLGKHTEARRHLEEALRLARVMGARQLEPHTLLMLSSLALRDGDKGLALADVRSALDIAVAVHDSFTEVIALLFLGQTEFALGRQQEATMAYDRARRMGVAIDHVLRDEALGGLARVALARGDSTQAMQYVERLLSTASGNASGRISIFNQLTCFQVLFCAGDLRAGQLLVMAHSELQARAATIIDANLRHSFLNNVPDHREIIAAWTAQQSRSAARPLG
jgi:class 3 adenylate cyclase/tetratricopeptide (TPR) repeat protein